MTQYELVKEVYAKNIELINSIVEKSKFPEAFKVLLNFFNKSEDLKKALEALEKEKAFYSSQSLARILNEHFLVAFYIFNKTRLQETDECAKDYLEYYPIFEMMKRDNYNSKLTKTYDTKKTPLENFFIAAPEFKGDIEESDIPDLNKRANQFDIRYILKYIQNEMPQDDSFKSLEKFILNDCKKYNETSTYVHAGRLAELQFFEDTPSTDKDKVMTNNAKLAEVCATQTLSFFMLLLILTGKEFVKVYQPVLDFIETSTPKKS